MNKTTKWGVIAIIILALLLTRKVVSGTKTSYTEVPVTVKDYLEVTPEHRYLMSMSSPVFNAIARCESQNIATADNPDSTAKGRFQFLDGTWKYYGQKLWGDEWVLKDPYNYLDNTELAWFVYTNYGTGDWNASISCWG